MCGILIYHKSHLDYLDNIDKFIKHRGPDKFNKIEIDDYIFTHSLLSINSNKFDKIQPVQDQEFTILFNGEIYNVEELKEKYDLPREFIDTDILIPLHKILGINFIYEIKGMFAIVIYNSKKKEFVLVRDEFGIKPLFYSKINQKIIISSEIKPIKFLKNKKKELSINNEKVFFFLTSRMTSENKNTFFKDIKNIIPGSIFRINSNNDYISENYAINKKYNNINQEDYYEYLSKKISIPDHNPIGLFYSGGYDSSFILELLLQKNKKFNIYSIYENDEFNKEENNNIRKNIDLFKRESINFYTIPHEDLKIIDHGKETVQNLDFPFPDASMICHHLLCKLAKSKDTRVILSGNGGDEIFFGYFNHVYSFLASLLKEKNLIDFYKFFKIFKKNININFSNYILKILFSSLEPVRKNKIKNYRNNKFIQYLNFKPNVYETYYENYADGDDFLQNISKNFAHKFTLPQFLDYEDKNSSNFGMESRPILSDWDIFNTNLNLNKNLLFTNGFKTLINNRFKSVQVKLKSKNHFNAPWLRYIENDKKNFIEFCFDNIDKSMILEKKIFKKTINDFFIKKKTKNIENIFRLYSLLNWEINSFNEII